MAAPDRAASTADLVAPDRAASSAAHAAAPDRAVRWAGRPRPRAPGLRLRLTLALLVTSAATLAAAFAALVPPLDHRVAQDRLRDLRELARTARPELADVAADELLPGSRPARALAFSVARRTGGRAALYDATGTLLADTGAASGAPAGALAEVSARLHRRGDVRDGVVGNEAVVLSGVHTRDGRLVVVLRRPLGEAQSAIDVVRSALPVAAAVGLGVALLLAVGLSRGLLLRLGRLRDDVRALGEHGLRHRITAPDGGSEVDEVARALEAMRVRLVDDAAAQQRFLATASHELRTPLAALQGTLELLREELDRPGGGTAAATTRADRALEQTHRLAGLSGDLLDLSRIDADVPLTLEPIDLAEAAARVVDEQRAAFARAGRTLVLRDAGGPVHGLADAVATTRILRILVDNAQRHGAGPVVLAVAPGRVEVADAGPGIAPEEREAVFARFHRGATGADAPGFGLGLTIARELARAMHGDLAVADGPAGARLVLELPPWSGPEGREARS